MEPLDSDYKMSVENGYYRFIKQDLVSRLIQLRPDDFRVERQQLLKPDDGSSLSIVYDDYQQVEGKTIPGQIVVDAVQQTDRRRVEMNFRSVSFGEELNFPFSFPSNMTFMEL